MTGLEIEGRSLARMEMARTCKGWARLINKSTQSERLLMSEPVLMERDGIVAVVTLNRPEILNAVDAATRAALISALDEANSDDGVRAVVITGAGERAFTAGQDLAELAGLDGDGGAGWVRSLAGLYQAIRDLDKPSVVAVNGLASGAGLQMALHSDLRVGHPGVRMGQPEINAGLPSVLGPWIMRQCIGLTRTQEMSLSARLVGAEQCLRFGLLDFIVPEDLVLKDAKRMAAVMGEKPPVSMRLTKKRVRELTQDGWDATVAACAELARQAFASGEPQRVAGEFLARRKSRS